MIYNLYCDESRHTSDHADRFVVIGAIKCARDDKRALVHEVNLLRSRFGTQGEIGWGRVAPNRLEFYLAVQELFLRKPELALRCIVVDRTSLDHERFNAGDAELGFYKLYYQLLIHWLATGDDYHVYLDWQQNSDRTRVPKLREILASAAASKGARLAVLETVESRKVALIQLTDLLIGAVGYAWNGRKESAAKLEFCQALAQGLGYASLKFSTGPAATKFNVFRFTGRQ